MYMAAVQYIGCIIKLSIHIMKPKAKNIYTEITYMYYKWFSHTAGKPRRLVL